ncbi:ATP-binding cassette domain-containing protein [Pseudooceanicola sediminis]|uniref:ATP-binding cassette domain-containing protein n=1 Tax=Pseudooceanicola sediminis TaxID=2211117 RepID=A0A399J5P7_9RHOB|nr:ATP-binding cassette domain-containing protein [Pseudooceanicola sediminis]KAA2316023.1 ATP-binding cassette domain-containing protein [Puniceibacterium sp. HSS470]RII38136.1 ATP-binding cassette domain-containing protein [Pseudooceanicola sediminis]|tara:strand:+ start:1135 stop:1872 length:738 start_codon:yes stop_codon:yes gene_type:complete
MRIDIDEIAKSFAGTHALHPVSLSIPSGAMVSLLGPSGSGKTTLLRIIAGLEAPTAGRVLFDGTDATGITVQARRAGFVFQSYALFRHMSVFENIAYGLRARPRGTRPSAAEIEQRVMTLLELIQLPGIASRYPAQLSGGQRQRVALARALATEPRVLLLDEPFGALDARVRRELRAGLRDIHDATGLTTIFVTHDQDEALSLADMVAVMSMGRIEQVGTPADIRKRPQTDFVRSFIERPRLAIA